MTRDVQTVREALRMQIVLNPEASLGELTRLMKQWSINDYGQRQHGTTHEQPYQAFCQRERPALKALPADRFEVAVWKQATVHPDHYILFQAKAYSAAQHALCCSITSSQQPFLRRLPLYALDR